MAEGATVTLAGLPGNSSLDIAFVVENVYRDIIIKYVRCAALLPHMCIPESDQEFYESVVARENNGQQREACRRFLDYLRDKGLETDYLLFLQLLQKEGYTDIVKLLTGDNTIDPDILREHLRLIQFFSGDITEKIDPDLMYAKLIQDDWMDQEDGEHLKKISMNNGRTAAARWLILFIIPRRKENWFKQLLQLLWDFGYCDLVQWIDDTFTIQCLKSSEEMDQDDGTGSEALMEDEDADGVNILTASGDAYNSLDVMDPVPANVNYTRSTSVSKPEREKTSLFDTDPIRLENWIPRPDQTLPSTRQIPDDMSIDSSQDDNTWYDIDIDDAELTTPEILKARDQVIRPLENRPYQEELAKAAGEGSNVVIIAPTGSGKTVVALMIMQNHICRLNSMGKQCKIAFFANEVTLVDQQHELFKHHLGSTINTMMIVGETKYKTREPLVDMIAKNGLLVMTPQIIVDALESKTLTSLSVFTLIIFDECHHVRDKHPTNQIMSHYMEFKHGRDTSVSLPQIVGLTASVGVGKRKDTDEREGAIRHIRTLCANLDAIAGLVTVRENKESLAEYANYVESAVKKANERQSDPFKSCIVTNIMEMIEERMINKQMESQSSLKHIKNLEKEVKPCQEKGTAWYTQWLGKLHSDKFLRIKKAQLRRFFLTCVRHLSIYNKALAINCDCRAIDAMRFIEEKISTLYPAPGYRTEVDEVLHTLFAENRKTLWAESRTDVNINPKLALLQYLILEQIKKKRESRIIVLVRTRDLARALVKWMEDDQVLKKLVPTVVTGCGASADEGGMTRAQQIEAVKSFKWGNSRVAVATSVAEEGMDVAKCSRVIRYEYVSNEIGMIQARGRASRVQDGTYYTVTSSEDVATKENNNILLESVMNEAIEYLQQQFNLDPVSFGQSLETIQRDDRTSRETEKMKLLAQPTTDENFKLHCYYCDKFALNSTDIRTVANSHRLVMATDIWQRVSEEEPEKKEAFDDMQKVSSVHCKECRSRWGSGVMYRGIKFVCISIANFMSYDIRGKSFHWNRWKKVHFKCQKMPKDDVSQFSAST